MNRIGLDANNLATTKPSVREDFLCVLGYARDE